MMPRTSDATGLRPCRSCGSCCADTEPCSHCGKCRSCGAFVVLPFAPPQHIGPVLPNVIPQTPADGYPLVTW